MFSFQHPIAPSAEERLNNGKAGRSQCPRLSRRRGRLKDDSAPLGYDLLWGAVKDQGQSERLRPDRRGEEPPRKQQPSDAKFKFQHRARATGRPAREGMGTSFDDVFFKHPEGWWSYALALEPTNQRSQARSRGQIEGPNEIWLGCDNHQEKKEINIAR